MFKHVTEKLIDIVENTSELEDGKSIVNKTLQNSCSACMS
jgi:hypothetical protein